jgi:hypothetical protein
MENQLYPIDIYPEWRVQTKEPPVSLGFWFGKESKEALQDYSEIDKNMSILQYTLDHAGMKLLNRDVDILSSKLFVKHDMICPLCKNRHSMYVEEHIVALHFDGGMVMYPGLVCINGKCPYEEYDEEVHQYTDGFCVRNNVQRIRRAIRKGMVFREDLPELREEAVKSHNETEDREIEYRQRR